MTSPTVIGVDGAKGGWVSARSSPNGEVSVSFSVTFAEIIAACGAADVVIVDMPVGLSERGTRPVDGLARARLGPRAATFFPTPIRSVLDFDDWSEANVHSKAVSGKGLSKQAWNLVPKIAEVDAIWSAELTDRLLEGHPETSFAELAGAPLATKKTDVQGRLERLDLLTAALGDDIAACIDAIPKKWSVDAIDALVLNWTARRVVSGTAIRLGGDPDLLGRPMQLTI